MYNFHYDYITPKYENKINLNYMDTDFSIYTIYTDDFYSDVKVDIANYFDTSQYSPDNPYNIPLVNKKKAVLMKDENNERIMRELIVLRPKMYSIDILEGNVIKKAKGVKQSAVVDLSLDNYGNCLYRKEIVYKSMLVFRPKLHIMFIPKM